MFKYKMSTMVIDRAEEGLEDTITVKVEAKNLEDAYDKLEEVVRLEYPKDRYDLFHKYVVDVESDNALDFIKESRNPSKYIQDISELEPNHIYIVETLGFEDREFLRQDAVISYLNTMTKDLRNKTRIKRPQA